MRRFGSFVAVMLLAVWLPATLHCGMETAGLWSASSACHDEQASDASADCHADACAIVESGGFRLQATQVLLNPPDLTRCLVVLVPARDVLEPPALQLVRTIIPAELIRSWNFSRRAAPPSRAPAHSA